MGIFIMGNRALSVLMLNSIGTPDGAWNPAGNSTLTMKAFPDCETAIVGLAPLALTEGSDKTKGREPWFRRETLKVALLASGPAGTVICAGITETSGCTFAIA
jgi:hypothetical protein